MVTMASLRVRVVFRFFFFFQAEDGIRDHCVTGVQTCALPIYALVFDHCADGGVLRGEQRHGAGYLDGLADRADRHFQIEADVGLNLDFDIGGCRSEERRVGKECRSWWWMYPCKKESKIRHSGW